MLQEAIFHAASRIFAGLLASEKVDQNNAEQAMKYSIATAIKMARAINSQNITDVKEGGGDVPFPW